MNRDIMYSDGYLCRDEDLEQLPAEILEDMMICIFPVLFDSEIGLLMD